MRRLLIALACLTACSSDPPAVEAPDAGPVDAGVKPPPATTFKFTLNGTPAVADKNVGAIPGNGTDHVILTGSYYNQPTNQTRTVSIDFYNTTGPGKYKCSDNLEGASKKQWTQLSYNQFIMNQPDPSNPSAMHTLTGDCTVEVTSWAAKSGDHYTGTFFTTGASFEIKDGVFELSRP